MEYLAKMRQLLSVGIVSLLVLAGCNREAKARHELESQGFSDVVLTKTGNSFTFTAKNADGQHCAGDITINGGSSVVTQLCSNVCTREESAKCFSMGLAAATTDPAKSTQYYVTGCEAGSIPSCTNAGVAYGKGVGVTKDDAASFLYDKKGCDGADAQGCVNLSIDYEEGSGTPQDLPAAYRAADNACSKNFLAGCAAVGRMLVQGSGVTADVTQGVEKLDRACKGNEDAACANLGMYLVEGKHGVTADVPRGQALLEAACAKDELKACANLGLYYVHKQLVDPTNTKMAAALNKACDKGEGAACNTLGYAMENGVGGFTADPAKGLVQYQKSCNLGHALACRNAGLFYANGRGTSKDMNKAATAWDTGCKLGDADSCKKRKALP